MKKSTNVILMIFLIWPMINTKADFFEELKSPLTTDARIPFLIGVGITGGTSLFKNSFVKATQEYVVEEKPLGKSSRYGDLMGQNIPNIAYILITGGIGLLNHQEPQTNWAVIMLKATLYSAGVATILKYTIREKRPNPSHNRASFPSGHSTSAFSFAATVAALHGPAFGIPAYAMATFVGYSRINDNAHWLHDVMGGATLGIGYGLGISYLSNKQSESFTWMPIPQEGGAAILCFYRF